MTHDINTRKLGVWLKKNAQVLFGGRADFEKSTLDIDNACQCIEPVSEMLHRVYDIDM